MKVLLDLELNIDGWETEKGEKMTEEQALEWLNNDEYVSWCEILSNLEATRVPGTNTFKGVI